MRNGALGYVIIAEETPVVSDFRKVVAMGEAGSAGVVMSSAGTQ